jgi:nitrogen fixation protein FixH
MTGEFTGRRMAFVMVSFFTVVVSVNVLLAVLANSSWTGLVVQNSYVASQHFDEVTSKLEKSAAMNFQAGLSYRDGQVRLLLRDAGGKAIPVRSIVLKLGRPSHESEDRTLPMTCSAAGDCVAAVTLGPGVWAGEADAELSSMEIWSRPVRLIVKGG